MELTENAAPAAAVPSLRRLSDFEAALAHYNISSEAQAILEQTPFAVLLGPTSSGRNTIIDKLVATGGYHFIISDTTRPPRVNNGVLEQNGVEYWFRPEDDMLADIKDGKFLEAEVIHRQQVSGISIRELAKAHNEHKIAITDIDIGGIENVVRLKPNVSVVMILPPSFEEWHRRLHNRGKMGNDEYRRRAETALRIFSAPLQYDYYSVVINDDLEQAVREVDGIARNGTHDPAAQARGVALARQLYDQLKQDLA